MNKIFNTLKLTDNKKARGKKIRNVVFIINEIDDGRGITIERTPIMEKLTNILRTIGFSIHAGESSCPASTRKLLKSFISFMKHTIDCCVIIVATQTDCNSSSFSGEASEMNTHLDRIVTLFNAKNCPVLKHKPKVFIFQHTLFYSSSTAIDDIFILPRSPRQIYDNMLIASSTTRSEFVTYKYNHNWYLRDICEGFEKYAETGDIESIIKVVNCNFNERCSQDCQLATCLVRNFDTYFFYHGAVKIPNAIKANTDSISTISNGETPRTEKPNACKVPIYETSMIGETLIINNIMFMENNEYRHGAEVDGRNIRDLFKEIGFGIQHRDNLTATTMRLELEMFSRSLAAVDICVVVIMSHGTNRSVLGGYTEIFGIDDDNISVEEVLSYFSDEACPKLRNKPKIFIFQCCRGTNTHFIKQDAIRPPITMHADMLIAYSTLPGFSSFRDPLKGTWYIQTICEVFKKHARELDIESLLKIVDNEMEKHDQTVRQVTHYESRGFKRRCYLCPI